MKCLCQGIVLLILMLANSAFAEGSKIDALIEQTGIQPGMTAMRDLPGWRKPEKILIYGGWNIDPDIQSVFPELEFVRAESMAEALSAAENADAIIGSCGNELVNAAQQATWVQISAAGADRCVQTDRIADGDVVLTNMQKMSAPVIAEHAVAMTLALARSLPQYIRKMDAGEWQDWDGDIANGMLSVQGRTLLVAGLGGIGTEVARRAAALGMTVIGTRRSSRDGPEFVEYVGLADELFELAARADFIVNALPLTDATTGLFDAEFFAIVKPGAYFINIGRGKTTHTGDLLAALRSGQLAGAGLDVTDPEPLPADHPLWQMPNVIITPHSAGKGADRDRHYTLLRENLRRFSAGEPLLNVVDPAAGY
jgi:phosphoglycerate dehydrogenase-like enzyme